MFSHIWTRINSVSGHFSRSANSRARTMLETIVVSIILLVGSYLRASLEKGSKPYRQHFCFKFLHASHEF